MVSERSDAVRLVDAATLAGVMRPRDWLEAAERAFLTPTDAAVQPPSLAIDLPGGSAHVKAACLRPDALLSIKLNANLPDNPRRRGLPTIQGVVVAIGAEDGRPLALVDSAALTAWRTAAATALALRTLMRPDARALTMVGCGALGWPHLTLLAAGHAWAAVKLFDRVRPRAEALARRARAAFGFDARVARNLASACAQADALVCATSARRPYLGTERLHAGLTVAAVGADHPHKRELGDGVLEAANLVVDRRAQALAMGEWHHQPRAARRPAELGEVLRGERPGRRRRDEVVIFDSTGFGLQDACAMAAVLRRLRGHAVPRFDFRANHSPPHR